MIKAGREQKGYDKNDRNGDNRQRVGGNHRRWTRDVDSRRNPGWFQDLLMQALGLSTLFIGAAAL